MKLLPLDLDGVILLEAEPVEDQRGFFARIIDKQVLANAGLHWEFEQESLARNTVAGTIRGMHFQASPHAEWKIVQCVRGALYDVVVDVRESSPVRGRWISITLDAERPQALYIPPGFAHGYQTLADGTDAYYHIAPGYTPHAARGINPLSERLDIAWPLPVSCISDRDRGHPGFA